MSRHKVMTTVYLEREQDRLLKELSEATGVPMAFFIREGVDYVLGRRTKYLDALKKIERLEVRLDQLEAFVGFGE